MTGFFLLIHSRIVQYDYYTQFSVINKKKFNYVRYSLKALINHRNAFNLCMINHFLPACFNLTPELTEPELQKRFHVHGHNYIDTCRLLQDYAHFRL